MTLDGDIIIQPLRSDDHPHWLPLWKDIRLSTQSTFRRRSPR